MRTRPGYRKSCKWLRVDVLSTSDISDPGRFRRTPPTNGASALLGSLDGEQVEEEDALRAAAEWARETMGLEFARLLERMGGFSGDCGRR